MQRAVAGSAELQGRAPGMVRKQVAGILLAPLLEHHEEWHGHRDTAPQGKDTLMEAVLLRL